MTDKPGPLTISLVYMPHKNQGKNRKLALTYHGSFWILDVQPNCLVVIPVDNPDDQAIRVWTE